MWLPTKFKTKFVELQNVEHFIAELRYMYTVTLIDNVIAKPVTIMI